ncbi:MAG: response regulator [Thermodesulfovibrionales bacterium]
MKILVVDDEQLVRWFLGRALRRNGHEVVTAENVQDASLKLASEAIDALVIDLRMPGENGAKLVGKVDIRGKIPKVIVCSAFVTAELEEELRQKGVCILRKPIMLDTLNDAIQICLEKDQRGEIREQIIADLIWSYSPSTDKNKGLLIEESKSGMSIMTYIPVKVGSILRIECKGSWLVSRYATVQWCREVAPNNYRCGLFVNKYY